jgi:hypothetical protein
MPRIPAAVAALALLLAPAAYAICPLNVRYVDNPPSLVWTDPGGVKGFEVQESFDNFVTSRNYFPDAPRFVIQRRSSARVRVSYVVTALVSSTVLSVGPLSEGCTETIQITLEPDAAFRTLTRKAVVPIVGSGAGANGGRFKTSLKLTATGPQQQGVLIFHPAGRVGTSDDPAMRYSLDGAGAVKIYDDIVDAVGQSGIGSLDIIPDEGMSDVIPNIDARMYNATAGGTFGTNTSALLPYDFLHAPTLELQMPAPDSQFRLNVGLRTLTETQATVLIYGTSGRLRDFKSLAWPANYTAFGTLPQFIGTALDAGESVTIFFDGAAIPFYTRTENRTNDPELFIPPHVRTLDAGSFVE